MSARVAGQVGAAVASQLPAGARVLIAGDFRLSTPELKDALSRGLVQAGAHVLDAGQVPTPVAYFACAHLKADGVVIVTASHNPPDHNGLKVMLGGLPPTPEDLAELRRRAEQGPWRKAAGAAECVDVVPDYRAWIEARWGGVGSGFRVVLDAGNGAWSELGPAIFERLGFQVERLFCEVDGRYPNRSPDTARPANLTALQARVRETGARLGVAWDGDGDRVAFADETGVVVTTDQMAVILVRGLVDGGEAEKVVHDVKLSDVVRRAVLERGGVPIMERSGHAFIKRRMIWEACLLGCEASGHYFFRELGGGDDGLFAALVVSEMVGRGESLARLREAVPAVYATPDIRLRRAALSYEETVRRLEALPVWTERSEIDGVRLAAAEGSVLVRTSVTEEAYTLRIEGRDEASFARLRKACLAALPEMAETIRELIRRG
jgi:phosphomannomutase / phosphoglucomutase